LPLSSLLPLPVAGIVPRECDTWRRHVEVARLSSGLDSECKRDRCLNKSDGCGFFQKIHPKTLALIRKKIHPASHLSERTYALFDQHTPQKSISMFDVTEEYLPSGTYPTEWNS
jgi:hypothetical protein